ncbi:hypothetical protein FOL47_003988 [Perkinsus chesapeaki]|uniref:Uncharacterized protein n=1 Tax=Perkinsus chesapeaki TaxID=330153 RepID=A0A7J6N1P6_PERCH|nr:hypothetical protein FOL47_003988 [Perkinsus chesapeaki]
MATTTSTSTGEATFVEDVKKRPDRTDSVLSGARTPSTVGDLTPGFRGRLDSSDPFWGLEFTEEMALAAMKKEMKKRVWPDSRVHTDGSAKQRTWRLDPTDFDMGHMFAAGEDTDGYVMKFGDFDMEYFFEDPNPPPEAMPLSWNMWEIELFGPIREDVKGMFKPEPVHDVERFVDHGHDYDTIDESELSDFWECWEISPVVHVGVVEAVLELLKDPVYVLTIDQSVLKGAEWLSLIRIHPVVEYPIILSQTSSCLHPQNLLETARAQQPALGCQGILPLLAGGIMQARLKALLSRLTRHEIVEADPRVQEESIRKWLWKACLDKSLTEAWPPTKWLGPLEMLYVEAQAVFVRDLGAIAGLLKAQHISGRTTADVNACPGLAVARAAVASRVLLVEGSEMLNMLDDDVSSMAQEVATLIVLSAMDTKWPYQQQPETVDDAAEVFFSHRFEREPWVPLSRLSAAFCHSGNSPLVPRQWRLKEPSQYALLAERLSKAIEAGKVYVGPRYLPPSYTLQDRVRSSLDYLSWCLAHQPQRSVPPREALSPLASWWDYIGLRLADLVWGIRDLMRLHQPGVLVHAYWLHKWSSAPKPLPKPSVYGGDAFAWKRPGRAGCETLALRMPAPPYRTVIDAVGSAAAVPVDHLASYLELRSNDIAQSWRSYRALNRYAELTAVFAKWLVVLGLLHSTVPSINMLP